VSPHDQFVELVKVAVTCREFDSRGHWRWAVAVVERAMSVAEWAPRVEDVRAAGGMAALVNHFVSWNYGDGLEQPEWFALAVKHLPQEKP
jgi:hypothetical protein